MREQQCKSVRHLTTCFGIVRTHIISSFRSPLAEQNKQARYDIWCEMWSHRRRAAPAPTLRPPNIPVKVTTLHRRQPVQHSVPTSATAIPAIILLPVQCLRLHIQHHMYPHSHLHTVLHRQLMPYSQSAPHTILHTPHHHLPHLRCLLCRLCTRSYLT